MSDGDTKSIQRQIEHEDHQDVSGNSLLTTKVFEKCREPKLEQRNGIRRGRKRCMRRTRRMEKGMRLEEDIEYQFNRGNTADNAQAYSYVEAYSNAGFRDAKRA